MRIVAGEFGGRPIDGPRSNAIRPTSDRNRESLFNILRHRAGFSLGGARVLDLFAGTGALGLEALSNGARFCLFVENGVEGRGLLRGNIDALGLGGRSKVFRRDATRLGEAGAIEPFDLVFADPPYGDRLGEAALASALRNGWLRRGAVAVLEEAADAPFELPAGFVREDERRMGASLVRFLRVAASRDAAP